MATAVNTILNVALQATHSESNALASDGLKSAIANFTKSLSWASGTGANQADRAYFAQRTVTSGATDALDLAGSLTDQFGAVLTMARIKLIWIYAALANTTTLAITRPAANGLVLFGAASGSLAPLNAGGGFLYFDPSATALVVTAGTGDLLNVVNSAGASAVYDIVVIGASA